MTAVILRLRAELRAQWLAWLAVALLAGFGAAIVLTLLAGARRTDAAYPEFAARQRASDVLIAGKSDFGLVGSVDLNDVEQLPEVADTARASASLLFAGETGDGRRVGPVDVFPVASASDTVGREIERWEMLEGRRADPSKVDEATASFVLADQLDVGVGDTIRLHFVKGESFIPVAATLLSQFGPRLAGDPGSEATTIDELADGPDITFRIVGIEASPAEFPPLGPDLSPVLHLTPEFARRHSDEVVASPIMYTRLKSPDDLAAFSANVEALAPGQPVGFIVSRNAQTVKVQRSVEVQADALTILAVLTLVALLVIVAQALVRQAFVEAAEDDRYRALGMTNAQGLVVAVLAALAIGLVAAVVAVVGAFLASPVMPIGLARTAEVAPGLDFDPFVLGVGALAVIVTVPLLALFAEWRVTLARRPVLTRRRAFVDRAVGDTAIPPTTSMGLRFALDSGRGSTSVPVWTAVLGAILAFVLLAGVWSFRSSLQALIDTPHLYGWNWDLKSGAPALPDIGATIDPALEADPAVRAFSSGTVVQADIDGERVDVLAIEQRQGTVAPTVLDGRLPRTPDEIMLGSKTLESSDKTIGDVAVVRIGTTVVGYEIVGRGVFPDYGDASRLGEGALTTLTGIRRVLPSAKENVFLMRYTDDADHGTTFERFRTALEPLPSRRTGRPRELEDLADVRSLPLVMAAILGLLAAATLAHALLTSVQRRRRELAILKTLGFRRGQVVRTVAWQATTLVGLALLVGLPLGVVVGRYAWDAFAEGLGVPPEPAYPWLLVALTVPAALLFGNAIAAIPAWIAGRTSPADVLREG